MRLQGVPLVVAVGLRGPSAPDRGLDSPTLVAPPKQNDGSLGDLLDAAEASS